MTLSTDTIFWIFSTFPQVLAALVGLIVTGVVFYYPSLDKRVEKNKEDEIVVDTVKEYLHRHVVLLLSFTTFVIIVDVVILSYAYEIISLFQKAQCSEFTNLIRYIFWLVIGLNLIPMVALVIILVNILSPKFESNKMSEERGKIIKNQAKAIIKEKKDFEKENKSKEGDGSGEDIVEKDDKNLNTHDNNELFSVHNFLFRYNHFEIVAHKWAEMQGLKDTTSLKIIIKMMIDLRVISTNRGNLLMEANKIRNFIAHGQSIPEISIKITNNLSKVTEQLERILNKNKEDEGNKVYIDVK